MLRTVWGCNCWWRGHLTSQLALPFWPTTYLSMTSTVWYQAHLCYVLSLLSFEDLQLSSGHSLAAVRVSTNNKQYWVYTPKFNQENFKPESAMHSRERVVCLCSLLKTFVIGLQAARFYIRTSIRNAAVFIPCSHWAVALGGLLASARDLLKKLSIDPVGKCWGIMGLRLKGTSKCCSCLPLLSS